MSNQEFDATNSAIAETQESAPETTVAPEVTETPEEAVNVESAPTQGEPEPKAIQELKAQRKKRQIAEQEAAYWRGVAEASNRQPAAPAAPTVPQPSEAPKLEDYEDLETFEAANVQYIIRQAEANIERKMTQKQAEEAARQVEESFKQRLDAASEMEPDIIDVINDPTLPVSDSMAQIIKRSDKSVELIKYLNLNRQAAQRMMRMSAHEVGYELGKIEAAFAREEKAAPPPKKVSMAPEPIQTVTPVGISDPDPDTLPIEEWMKKFGAPARR